MSYPPKSKIILPAAAAVYLLDRVTKLLVVSGMEPGGSRTVVDGFFDLTYVRNTGAAFGILSYLEEPYRLPFFAVTTLAALALLSYFIHKTKPGEVIILGALALVMGGAAGNLTDRVIYGYVVDFIDWHVGGFYWPAFNIADSGITVGMILLGIELVIRGKLPGTEEGGEE